MFRELGLIAPEVQMQNAVEENSLNLPLTCFSISPNTEGSPAWLRAILCATYGGAAEAEPL